TLAAHGMGQVLDIVPNHMGVASSHNAWWDDVLQHGRASPHARTFDIEWDTPAPGLRGRVLLPVLGDHLGRELEAGRLQLRFHPDAGQMRLHYWEHHWPLDPAGTARTVRAAPVPGSVDPGSDELAQVQSLLDAFEALPPRDTPDE